MTDVGIATPGALKEARQALGLSVAGMAAMLGVGELQVRRMELPPDRQSHRPVTGTTARLLRAYLDGYRPADWPGKARPED